MAQDARFQSATQDLPKIPVPPVESILKVREGNDSNELWVFVFIFCIACLMRGNGHRVTSKVVAKQTDSQREHSKVDGDGDSSEDITFGSSPRTNNSEISLDVSHEVNDITTPTLSQIFQLTSSYPKPWVGEGDTRITHGVSNFNPDVEVDAQVAKVYAVC